MQQIGDSVFRFCGLPFLQLSPAARGRNETLQLRAGRRPEPDCDNSRVGVKGCGSDRSLGLPVLSRVSLQASCLRSGVVVYLNNYLT